MNRFAWTAILGGLVATGCKSDISQQLLERELRMQEDQIYLLQDEIQDKCSRLEHVAAENRSLKRQLGIVDADASLPSRIDVPPAVAAPARGPAPALVPPAVSSPAIAPPPMTLPEPVGVPPLGSDSPDGPRFAPPPGGSSPPEAIAPPALDGVPPLPDTPPRGASAIQEIKRLSHEESLSAEGKITHLVINPERTTCFDGDGDGTGDGLAIVFEPRDADERLVTAGGDVSIVAYDPATPGGPEGAPLAKWDIPAAESLAHFRRTSRARGLHFTLPWQGLTPAGDHVRVFVKLTTFDGQSFETDATIPTR